jgi:hypothetical protein
MVKLLKYNKEKGEWVVIDYGIESQTDSYVAQGYIVQAM